MVLQHEIRRAGPHHFKRYVQWPLAVRYFPFSRRGRNLSKPDCESFLKPGPFLSENPVINNGDNPSNISRDGWSDNSRGETGAPGGEESSPVFLELVYGMLFEPGKTIEKVVQKPPLGVVALVVAILSVPSSLMGMLIISKPLNAAVGHPFSGIGSFMSLGIILGLFWGYMKWFGYGAIVHLAADLLGGDGAVRGVFAVTGLAGLPLIFNIPVQFLGYWFGGGATVLAILGGLVFGVWSIVLLVAGVRRAHGLSLGRAALAVFTPALALMFLLTLIITAMVFIVYYEPSGMSVLGYF